MSRLDNERNHLEGMWEAAEAEVNGFEDNQFKLSEIEKGLVEEQKSATGVLGAIMGRFRGELNKVNSSIRKCRETKQNYIGRSQKMREKLDEEWSILADRKKAEIDPDTPNSPVPVPVATITLPLVALLVVARSTLPLVDPWPDNMVTEPPVASPIA